MSTAQLKPTSAQLPPFDAGARCSKCGGKEVKTHYCNRKRLDKFALSICLDVDGEHQHRFCVRCSYEWLQACIAYTPRRAKGTVNSPARVRQIYAANQRLRAKKAAERRDISDHCGAGAHETCPSYSDERDGGVTGCECKCHG